MAGLEGMGVSNLIRAESIAAHLIETHEENAERIVQGLMEAYEAAGNEAAQQKWKDVALAIAHLRSLPESNQTVRKYGVGSTPAPEGHVAEASPDKGPEMPTNKGQSNDQEGAHPESQEAHRLEKDEERMILEFQAIELRRMRDEVDFLRRQNERLVKLVEYGRRQ